MEEEQTKKEEAKNSRKNFDGTKIGKFGSLIFGIFSKPLKQRYEKHYRTSKMHLIVDLVLALIVIMLLGSLVNLWLFSRSKLINLMDFGVTSSPEILINGQDAQFVINYSNTTSDELTDVVLILKLPNSLHDPQFDSKDFDPKTHSLKIGELKAHGSGELKVSGLILDSIGAKQEFLAAINYKNKYGQDRQEFFSQDFQLNQSVVDLKITLPEKIIATSPFDGNIYINSAAGPDFKNFKIKIVAPDGFTLIKTELGDASNQVWPISLVKNKAKNFKFTGKVYVNNPQILNFQDEIYATYQDQEYLLAVGTASAPVEFSKFILDFSSPEKNQYAKPGDKITYTVHYKNTENFTIKNIQLGLELAGDYADLTSATKNFKTISSLPPGEEGTADITVATKPNIDFTTNNESGYSVEVRVIAFFDSQNGTRTSVESLPLTTKMSSRLSLDTTTLFFTPEGDQIGVGVVPPQVGQYTSYWVVIKVLNTNNKVKNAKIIAQVPSGVEFTDIYNVTSGNQIIYHKDTNQIEWQIEEIPALAGIYNTAPEARIQLAITPTSDQIGTSPQLLSNISASATDEVTGELLTAAGKSVNVVISSDPILNKVIQ